MIKICVETCYATNVKFNVNNHSDATGNNIKIILDLFNKPPMK